jgi:hypothetical protein
MTNLAQVVSTFDASPPTFRGEGANDDAIRELEEMAGMPLPHDVATLVRRYGSAFGIVGFALELDLNNELEDYREKLRGLLVLGSDGGGNVYACDVGGALGCGVGVVIMTSMGELDPNTARVVGTDLADVLLKLLAKVDLFECPKVCDTRR